MLLKLGFSSADLLEANVSLEQLQMAGAAPQLLIAAGFAEDEVRHLQVTVRQKKVAAYTDAEINHLKWVLKGHTDVRAPHAAIWQKDE